MNTDPYIPTEADAQASLTEAKHKAAVNLPLILERIVERAFDPTSNFKQLMDSGEFVYKVSGMAAKQAEKPTGAGFSITIKLPGAADTKQEIVIGSGTTSEPSRQVVSMDEMPDVPKWLTEAVDVSVEDDF